MKELHILFTGVGRRVELVQAFHQASVQLNIPLKIYGADMSTTAPALLFCDYTHQVCGIKEPNYIPQLLQICKQDQIDLVIPTIDTDLLLLAQAKSYFEKQGTRVLISQPDKIAICRDKNLTGDFFEKCGLKAPRTVNNFTKYTGPFPCFIKPKDGSSSINAFKVNSAEELFAYAAKIQDYIIQPFIEGTEYTIDIFCDFNGQALSIVPRVRLAVRSGEVLKTQIALDQRLIEESHRIIHAFKPCGPLTVQVIREKNTGDDYFIEINPRYGGGAPLSMKAGARSAEYILNLLANKPVSPFSISDGAVYSRFDQSVCVQPGKTAAPLKGIIFDLDDTLYPEKDYVKSGYSQVARLFPTIPDAADQLWQYFQTGKPAIDVFLQAIGQENRKEECVKLYRNHLPDIKLYKEIKPLLLKLKSQGVKLGLITDGRPEGQRNKIKALGLDTLIDDILITDELGGPQFRKPCDIAFRILQLRWNIPFDQLLYVGDNPVKDFLAPRTLGMKTIWFKNPEGLYHALNSRNWK